VVAPSTDLLRSWCLALAFVALAAVSLGLMIVAGPYDPQGRAAPVSATTPEPVGVIPAASDAPAVTPARPRESRADLAEARARPEDVCHEEPASGEPEAERVAAIGRGRDLFVREWMPDDPRTHGGDGLGPVYNDSSCTSCHNLGGIGGGGPNGKNVDILSVRGRSHSQTHQADGDRAAASTREAVQEVHPGFRSATSVVLHRFGIAPDYVVWRLERLGMAVGTAPAGIPANLLDGPPDVLAKVDIEHSRASARSSRAPRIFTTKQSLPRNLAVGRSQRNPTALFGAGLIDAIPDHVIEEQAARTRTRFPEIHGRVSRPEDGRVGRFGWKAQISTLREFVLTACSVELGLEVPGHPQGGDPQVPDIRAPGLDLTSSECDDLFAFIRSLRAPREQDGLDDGSASEIRAGKELFRSIGCGVCHVPDLGDVQGIYSDLLLHDMGPESSDTGSYRVFRPEPMSPGLAAPDLRAEGHPENKRPATTEATEREWRTPPLWGIRDSSPYLHDGRADTLDQAIALHGGQGKDSAARYFGLSPRRRQQVQAFLKSLVAPASPRAS
jgi:CxxC motif-containing protein (DUF1111 family)